MSNDIEFRKRVLTDAKPHTAKKAKDKLDELDGVEVLPHSHLQSILRFIQHLLKGRRFESFDEVKEACQEFFDSKLKKSYIGQIRYLVDR